MTSNIGSEHILEGEDEKVIPELNKYFKPEFINRIDEIIVFKKLSKEVLQEVLDKIINEIDERLIDLNIKIKLTPRAKNYFIENGYNEFYGARPLKRLINRKLETNLAKLLIDNQIVPNKDVLIDVENNNIKVSQ